MDSINKENQARAPQNPESVNSVPSWFVPTETLVNDLGEWVQITYRGTEKASPQPNNYIALAVGELDRVFDDRVRLWDSVSQRLETVYRSDFVIYKVVSR